MAPRTLSSTWRNFERLAKNYWKNDVPDPENMEEIRELARKANKANIGDAIATIFVNRYTGMEEVTVVFGDDESFSEQPTHYDPEAEILTITPTAVMKFYLECNSAVDRLKTAGARESFETYRLHAFLAELRKLPSLLVLFLVVLKQVAKANHITQVERKGGGIEVVEDGGYMLLLWAFKELERIYRELKAVSIRSEYTVLWYESDWIAGKK